MSSNNTSIINEMREQLLLLTMKLEFMEKVIEKQAEKIENNNRVICSLVNGLFNHSSQIKTITEYTEMIFGESSEEEKEEYENLPNNNRWGNYPTTRQGDEHEQRIERLEAKFNAILEIIEEEESSSQYSNRVYPEEQEYRENTNNSIISGNSLISQTIELNDTSSIMTDDLDDSFDF
jgi:hypothetical protein